MLDGEWGVGRTLTARDQTLLTYQVRPKQARTLQAADADAGTLHPCFRDSPRKMDRHLLPWWRGHSQNCPRDEFQSYTTLLQTFTSPQRSFSSSNFILKSRLYLPGTPYKHGELRNPSSKVGREEAVHQNSFVLHHLASFHPGFSSGSQSIHHQSSNYMSLYHLSAYLPTNLLPHANLSWNGHILHQRICRCSL